MKHIYYLFSLLVFSLILISCSSSDDDQNISENENTEEQEPVEVDFYRSADMSFLPEAEREGAVYLDRNGDPEDALVTLKNAGANAIRIRLWKDPEGMTSSFEEVKAFAERVKQEDMQVWLTVHYSDTWADPGEQQTPAAWQGLSFEELKSAFKAYTLEIMTEIQPDIFQIGNEINSGFMHPQGNINSNSGQFKDLLSSASQTIRELNSETKLMLHFAGLDGSEWFFNQVSGIDYDLIGISYYPIFHGTNLQNLENTIESLGSTHTKPVVLAEIAYPFTLGYNDFTNNIVGLEEHMVDGYPATPNSQKNYLVKLKSILKQSEYGKGFAYWGTEWIAYRGDEATDGSSWENQALWDFDNKALPAMEVFNKE